MEPSCSDEQGNVVESKSLVISCSPGIFTRTKTKEESNTDHVGNGFAFRGRTGLVGKEESVDNQGDRHGLDTNRCRVVLFKRPQLGLNMIINHTVRHFPGIAGPHPREFLCNGKEGARNYFSSDGSTTWGKSTVSVSGRKDLQVGDKI